MKTIAKKGKTITETDFDGTMMVYTPTTKKQEKELADWVAGSKAKNKAKQSKSS